MAGSAGGMKCKGGGYGIKSRRFSRKWAESVPFTGTEIEYKTMTVRDFILKHPGNLSKLVCQMNSGDADFPRWQFDELQTDLYDLGFRFVVRNGGIVMVKAKKPRLRIGTMNAWLVENLRPGASLSVSMSEKVQFAVKHHIKADKLVRVTVE